MARLTARFPERAFTASLILRASFLWLVLRTLAVAASAIAPSPRTRSPWMLTIPAAIFLIFLVGGLALLDARRRNEDRFLANLGVSGGVIALLSMAPAAVAEILIGILGS
jgi:hypothetical protein